jgi:hypothetical protein
MYASFMDTTDAVNIIRQKYQVLDRSLSERTRRLWAATEAHALGRGGITVVERAIGMDRKTIRRGLKEMETSPNAEWHWMLGTPRFTSFSSLALSFS